jgi:hypothetical protein
MSPAAATNATAPPAKPKPRDDLFNSQTLIELSSASAFA